ncbi:Helicase C-terminal [Penicillium samsonianum]|uniref:Helicase C-terminal n=1 Tax=Penicillium samsonianum TaxID=1882272 RepID=UPI002546AE79|nr:Helicase C-terminal [Penicillium samsonianum]KAJ6140294.1 Helicase C-terminal [Penicillium samsonianum]
MTEPGAGEMGRDDEETYVEKQLDDDTETADIGDIPSSNENILQSLVTKGTRKFNRMKELERLLPTRQPSDKIRRSSTFAPAPS